MSGNSSANKSALVNAMSLLLSSTYTQPVINVGSTTVSNLSVSGNNNNFVVSFSAAITDMFLGACFTANSITFVICASVNGSSGNAESTFNSASTTFLVDVIVTTLSSHSPTFNSVATTVLPAGGQLTVQNILNTFLAGPSQLRYSFVVASTVNVINNNSAFYFRNAGRLLFTIDDGSVFLDSSKFTLATSSVAALNVCTFANFNNKIKIAGLQKDLNSSNVLTVNSTSPNPVSLTIGSAGGNNINENHNTRPEILLALLSSGGVGFANRYSSSTSSVNAYYAIRFGTVSEANIGTVRVNVPLIA
jgi:hypothetical protein